ncbi:MAG: FHA domain-containing protein [Bacteroidota bacterium]
MKYTVGRSDDNDIVLNYPQVSRRHAILTRLSDHVMLLEDQGSSGGTFVNDRRVRRATISTDDKIKFANVRLDLKRYFAANTQFSPAKPAVKKVGNDYSEEFLVLKQVYETYESSRKKISRGAKIKRTLVRAGFAFIPFAGNALGILAAEMLSVKEKLTALDQEFKLHYVCPKCKVYLGNVPWEGLASRKSCRSCKAEWVAKEPTPNGETTDP